ncbi:hypothetical protein GX420_03650 [bacterium]|nr:hypothetical protein [bacterium]
MITVKVVDRRTGKPVKGARVALYITGFLTSGVTKSQYTNEFGEAYFDNDSASTVYVNGNVTKKGLIKGLVVINI